MDIKERFGLKQRNTYEEIVRWLESNPKGVPYPNRVAMKTYNSHVYGQLKDSLRNHTQGLDAFHAYQHRGDDGSEPDPEPFVPPRPTFAPPRRPQTFNMAQSDFDSDAEEFFSVQGGGDAPGDDDDDMMGPPGHGPESYGDLLRQGPESYGDVFMAEGMQPPPPPAAPGMMQQAGGAFAQAAGSAAGGVVGAAAGEAAMGLFARAAAASGFGAAAGAEAGPIGILAGGAIGAAGSLISDSIFGLMQGGSTEPPPGVPVSFGPGGPGAMRNRMERNHQESINRQQHLHNQGTGAPAAQVDFRTLNGMNTAMQPKDRKPNFGTSNGVGSTRVGVMGGRPGGSAEPMIVSTFRDPFPGPPLDTGGTMIPANADPAPMAPPNYLELVRKLEHLKEIQPSFDNPVGTSRPRIRTPRRGDRRPLEVQRRRQKDPDLMFPGGDNRDEALARRSKTVPRARKATGAPSDEIVQDRRRPNPQAVRSRVAMLEQRLAIQPKSKAKAAPKPKAAPQPKASPKARGDPKSKPEPKGRFKKK